MRILWLCSSVVAFVLLLGPLPATVLVAEILLNTTSMFNHSNIRLAPGLEKALRYVIVTPNMHRIHHSTLPGEHAANFGFNFPWRDRSVRLDRLLWQPMRRGAGSGH